MIPYKFKMRAWSMLHPIRTLKAYYFDHYIQPTKKWIEIQKTDPHKAVDMKWNRFFRRKFPWNNPRTLGEKMTWLLVNTDTSKWTEYSDKYEVRKYIESLGLGEILTKCYGVWDRAADIDFDSLPNSFVLKCTHDCGSTVIVRDKNKMNKDKILAFLQGHLDVNYGYDWCEFHYGAISPRVMAESIIGVNDGIDFLSEETVDHKIRCIDGKAQYDLVCYGRKLASEGGSNKSVVDLYDIESWTPMRQYLSSNNIEYKDIPRPENLERMIEIAELMSRGFSQVRIDMYSVKEKIYFGEMTFYSGSGMNNYLTPKFQRIIGDRITLPKL